ncbi:MAG: DUF4296 domain-containing protein [Bacteroidales bacterium]|nr:DUF4296 domain-containing protein [Bacteroidales bacterium]
MSRFVRNSIAVIFLALCLCSCSREGRVIPRNRMARIYAEMFLADSWVNQSSQEIRERADTTALYRPIIEKYGYTLEDYWASIAYYLQDPDRFSRILRKASDILGAEVSALEKAREAAMETPPVEEAEP